MNKNYVYRLFSYTLIIVTITYSILQAQVPNPSFENWTNGQPDGWWTNNLPSVSPNITKSTDAESGASAVKGEVISLAGIPWAPALGAGASNLSGFAVSQRYKSLKGYYKLHSIGNDYLYLTIGMWKNGQVIGLGSDSIKSATDNYTPFSTGISYFSNETPDSCIIIFAIYSLNSDSSVHIGSYFLLDNLSLTSVTPVNENNYKPNSYKLFQNYPNPFNPTTTIGYQIPEQSYVKLKVYDVTGRKVASLVNREESAGNYKINFNASNLSSGIYFYKLQAGSFTQVKKLILVK